VGVIALMHWEKQKIIRFSFRFLERNEKYFLKFQ